MGVQKGTKIDENWYDLGPRGSPRAHTWSEWSVPPPGSFLNTSRALKPSYLIKNIDFYRKSTIVLRNASIFIKRWRQYNENHCFLSRKHGRHNGIHRFSSKNDDCTSKNTYCCRKSTSVLRNSLISFKKCDSILKNFDFCRKSTTVLRNSLISFKEWRQYNKKHWFLL